jgi:hypothetical protein
VVGVPVVPVAGAGVLGVPDVAPTIPVVPLVSSPPGAGACSLLDGGTFVVGVPFADGGAPGTPFAGAPGAGGVPWNSGTSAPPADSAPEQAVKTAWERNEAKDS